MSETPPTNGHGSYERRDIATSGVLSFLLMLAAGCVITAFLVNALYNYLEARNEKEQAPISPLVTSTVKDTRHLPPEYKTDSEGTDYQKYLEKNFPAPRLETDERSEINKDRMREEQTLATYDYVDKNAGSVRIPIDRAMDLIAQRGLPVRQGGDSAKGEAKGNKQ